MDFALRDGRSGDVDAVTRALADAFDGDPLMRYFFAAHPAGPREATRAFFTLLMRVRLAIGAPVIVLETADGPRGIAMGYTTVQPDWPEALERDWAAFESQVPGLPDRFERYEAASQGHEPPGPHWYLGVIGVDPALRGRGGGRRLIDAFCARAATDPASTGVYLETGNPVNLPFYRAAGFDLRGAGDLEGTPVWCLFRPR